MLDKIIARPILAISILVMLASYLFLFQSGKLALTDPDEVFYAQTAKEMLARGEWVTPYLYDKPQFEKPILFYWLVETSYKIFGVNEFSSRFPSAVFGLIGIIATYLFGGLLFNKRVGLIAALILSTNVEYIILSRACVTDMVFGTFILLGFLSFFYGYLKERGYFYLLSSAFFGAAVLTKGPVAVILGGAIILSTFLFNKDRKLFRKIPLIQSILVFLALALPWYLAVYKLHGRAFVDAFLGFHNVTRFLEAEHKIGGQFYYNIPVVFGGLFPWSAFLPFGLWHAFKKVRSPQSIVHSPQFKAPSPKPQAPSYIFLLAWFFVIFIFFSISSTKLPTYIFPCFPSLALIIAVLWDSLLGKDASQGVIRGMKFSYYLLLVAITIGAAGLYLFINKDLEYRFIMVDSVVAGLFFIFGMALSFIAFRARRYAASFFLIIYSVVLFIYPLSRLVLPSVEIYETSKEISRQVLVRMKPDERIGCERDYLAGVAFYTDKVPASVDKHHLLTQFLSSDKRVWCVMKEKNFHQLYELNDKPYYTKPSYLVYRLGKKCIFTNKIPDDGLYLLKKERAR